MLGKGSVGGWVIKKFDKAMEGHMPAGFEMLINNFSIGILGMILAIIGSYVIGPFMAGVLVVLTAGVDVLVNHGLLPLAAIFIEPAKVLFLNNAINHGIFTPIATLQAEQAGKSIMYMLEANPGPGLEFCLHTGHSAKIKQQRFRTWSNHHSLPGWYPRNLLPIHPDESGCDHRTNRR